jgi:hypothetical protein
MTRHEAQLWLKNNTTVIKLNRSKTKEEIETIYQVYNALTGENKKHSGCSKCLYNTLKRLEVEYEKIKDKRLVTIYRTPFKQLSLKPQKEIAYQFLVKDDEELEEKLEYMKNVEKAIKNEN